MTKTLTAVPTTAAVTTGTFTIDQLAISPLNVRFNEEDCDAVEALQASIVAEGLLQPLVLHPIPKGAAWAKLPGQKQPAGFGVLAGGRRCRAIRRAIEAGDLPAGFAIAASVRDLPAGAIILLSLSENLLRRNLRDYEVHHAIAAAHAEGLDVAEIARQIGQRPVWVAQQLRLGELQPEIFAAYVAGDLSAEMACAYAATDDHELQLTCFSHFRPLPRFQHHAAAIRAFMKIGDRELDRQLLFVGAALYRAKGGRFELDLFAAGPDAMRGRVVDEPILRALVAEKLEVLRARIRETLAARDLRFIPRPPEQGGYTDYALHLEPPRGGWEKLRLPSEEIVATIDIDDEGNWSPRFWWSSRKAMTAASKAKGSTSAADPAPTESHIKCADGEALADHAGGFYDREGHRIARDDYGLTKDGLAVVRALRRDLLRALLVQDAVNVEVTIARDYLTWAQLRAELKHDRDHQTGARCVATESWNAADREPTELLRDHRDGSPASAIWAVALDDVARHPAFAEPDHAIALNLFLEEEPSFKRLAEAVLAGLTLVRSANAPGWRIATHDVLADWMGADSHRLRALWEPTHAFTALFGKMHRLAMAQPFVDPSVFKDWHKLKDKPLAAVTAAALQGLQGGSEAEAAMNWVHPLLSFNPHPADAPSPPAHPEPVEGSPTPVPQAESVQ